MVAAFQQKLGRWKKEMIWVKYPQLVAMNPEFPTLPCPRLIMVSRTLVGTSEEWRKVAERIRNISRPLLWL